MNKIIKIVGTGPGARNYITPIALETIARAEVLIASSNLLKEFAREDQLQIPLGKDFKKIIKIINEQKMNKEVVVMVSGDTGMFSLAEYLSRYINEDELEYIPGISAVQLMFARIKKSWQDVEILSMHGRKDDLLVEKVEKSKTSLILSGEPWTVQKIARFLLDKGVADLKIVLGVDLSLDSEQLVYSSLKNIVKDEKIYKNVVMVIFNEK